MFRGETQSRPLIVDFEAFLSRHGFEISWQDYAELPYYHSAEAAAVIERVQEEEIEGFENLFLFQNVDA
jgi:hypothetical protein